ncbi:DUF3078 domain-containing protein [Flavobacteriaceae bacterium]|nr:DUF3078 domain-containing protein [Flavobacteriaceae bacterium]
MKKILLLITVCLSTFSGFSQEKKEATKGPWTKVTNMSLLFNQAAFNNQWQGGGTSNYAANFGLIHYANYSKDKLTWDNRIVIDYGIANQKDQEFTRKTNDRFELSSLVGKQIKETPWYYSFFLNARTQLTNGYDFGEDEDGNPIRTETTKILSPGYFQAGLGILWKKSDNLKLNIAPATARLILVNSQFTDVGQGQSAIDAFNQIGYFGVKANETSRFEFGAAIGGYGKFTLSKNIVMENVLNLYSNYLEDLKNVDIDYTISLVMSVNKWITANIAFQAIYDDNAVKGFQIREALGVGLTYGF